MHSDEKYRQLSRPQPNGQSLWQHLLHGPETTIIPGLVIAGRAQLAETLKWPLEDFDKVFQEVLVLGMAKADWDARLIWLPKGPNHNPPRSPNVVIAWGSFWPEIPSCALKDEIFQDLKVFIEGLKRPFHEVFAKAFCKDLPNPGSGTGTGIVLPDWLDKFAWADWEQHRREKRDALTPLTIKRQLAFLEANKADHVAIINRSIEKGWAGLFELKDNHANGKQAGGKSAPDRVRQANEHLQ